MTQSLIMQSLRNLKLENLRLVAPLIDIISKAFAFGRFTWLLSFINLSKKSTTKHNNLKPIIFLVSYCFRNRFHQRWSPYSPKNYFANVFVFQTFEIRRWHRSTQSNGLNYENISGTIVFVFSFVFVFQSHPAIDWCAKYPWFTNLVVKNL